MSSRDTISQYFIESSAFKKWYFRHFEPLIWYRLSQHDNYFTYISFYPLLIYTYSYIGGDAAACIAHLYILVNTYDIIPSHLTILHYFSGVNHHATYRTCLRWNMYLRYQISLQRTFLASHAFFHRSRFICHAGQNLFIFPRDTARAISHIGTRYLSHSGSTAFSRRHTEAYWAFISASLLKCSRLIFMRFLLLPLLRISLLTDADGALPAFRQLRLLSSAAHAMRYIIFFDMPARSNYHTSRPHDIVLILSRRPSVSNSVVHLCRSNTDFDAMMSLLMAHRLEMYYWPYRCSQRWQNY